MFWKCLIVKVWGRGGGDNSPIKGCIPMTTFETSTQMTGSSIMGTNNRYGESGAKKKLDVIRNKAQNVYMIFLSFIRVSHNTMYHFVFTSIAIPSSF